MWAVQRWLQLSKLCHLNCVVLCILTPSVQLEWQVTPNAKKMLTLFCFSEILYWFVWKLGLLEKDFRKLLFDYLYFYFLCGIFICGEYYLNLANTVLQKAASIESSCCRRRIWNVIESCQGIKPMICWSLQIHIQSNKGITMSAEKKIT